MADKLDKASELDGDELDSVSAGVTFIRDYDLTPIKDNSAIKKKAIARKCRPGKFMKCLAEKPQSKERMVRKEIKEAKIPKKLKF